MAEERKQRKLIDRLKDRYRLLIMNDTTFEEAFVWRLTPLSLYIAVGATVIILVVTGISLVAFTPLREYIPGYADEVSVRKTLYELTLKTDSLEHELKLNQAYISNVNSVIGGTLKPDSILIKRDTTNKYKKLLNTSKPSKQDSLFRSEVEAMERYSLNVGGASTKKNGIAGFFFFTPVKGVVSNSFNSTEDHFGVDVVTQENEAIKSTLEGTVTLAVWSIETGYTLQIQHNNNIISLYKHCSRLTKKAGDYVKAGEVVGIVGNTGEQTSGPHLHFELWHNGSPIDPQDCMVF